jgi:hypothetical protein
MKRVVRYTAIDPYYSDQEQTYIGSNSDEIDAIQYETERFMAREHCSLGMIYRTEVIKDETDYLQKTV